MYQTKESAEFLERNGTNRPLSAREIPTIMRVVEYYS
jgi:hypothetical protein